VDPRALAPPSLAIVGTLGRGFDLVPDQYDDARPHYPDALYDAVAAAVGGLAGRDVLDLAAGTGIATRAMLARGARVVPLDPSEPMIRRLRVRSPRVPAVIAAGESLPLRDQVVDLVTCATAWHWLDTDRAVAEVRRVLRPGGHLALWWANNRWGDGVPWEQARSAVYDRWQTEHGSRPPRAAYAGVLPAEAAADLRARGLAVMVDTQVAWTRERTREEHVSAIATHSDVIALGDRKQRFLDEVASALAPWPVVTERLAGPLVIARF
jgi:SAM-dependent methyltransferase